MAKQRRSGAGAGNVASNAVRPKPERTRRSVPRGRPSQRTSSYRGVTRHRWTGRFEAHLWDKNTWTEPQRKKKGRQVYLGAYGGEEAAARAYDLAALKYWGRGTVLNFSLSSYDQELKEMEEQSREEYIGSLRRKSTGFSRGVSKYRGVARHHHNGKWEARIGRVFGNKYLYLGTYVTQEEATMAYDIAAIEHCGLNAVINFDVSRYIKWHHRCHADDAGGLNTPRCVNDRLQPPQTSPTSHAASALGPLLKAPRLKEMMERVAASQISTNSLSSSSCPPSAPPPTTQRRETKPRNSSMRCSFPDDVQTYFGCGDEEGMSGLAEVDTFLFGDLGVCAELGL
ncbi:AP2-like ethylene-responsive transcription factor At1g79700 [Triticum urartu]|nr:AP2-like ethylene-responsive transcription factor At1g79700 [Triticum urartu]